MLRNSSLTNNGRPAKKVEVLSLSNAEAAILLKRAGAMCIEAGKLCKAAATRMPSRGAGSDIPAWTSKAAKLGAEINAGADDVRQIED